MSLNSKLAQIRVLARRDLDVSKYLAALRKDLTNYEGPGGLRITTKTSSICVNKVLGLGGMDLRVMDFSGQELVVSLWEVDCFHLPRRTLTDDE